MMVLVMNIEKRMILTVYKQKGIWQQIQFLVCGFRFDIH